MAAKKQDDKPWLIRLAWEYRKDVAKVAFGGVIGWGLAWWIYAEYWPAELLRPSTAKLVAETSGRKQSVMAALKTMYSVPSDEVLSECKVKYDGARQSHNALIDFLITSLYTGLDSDSEETLEDITKKAQRDHDDLMAFISEKIENEIEEPKAKWKRLDLCKVLCQPQVDWSPVKDGGTDSQNLDNIFSAAVEAQRIKNEYLRERSKRLEEVFTGCRWGSWYDAG